MPRSLPLILTAALAGASLAACASSSRQAPNNAPEAPRTETAAGRVEAAAPARPAPFEPVGRYDYTTSANGTEVTGTVTISGTPGNYTAAMTSNATPEITFKTVTVEGNRIRMEGPGPESSTIVINLVVAGTDVTGDWSMGGMAGEIRGTKVKPGTP
ncbi:MAG: hypothetical protein WKG32_16385 [Gemmatimonadaceae bacterium]